MLSRERNDSWNCNISSLLRCLSFMWQIGHLFNFILYNDASLPSDKNALKNSRHQTNCSELKINLKLICYKNTTFLVLVIFGCFAIIKIYLKCWTTFFSAVHVHNYDTFLSVFLFEKNKILGKQ